MAAKNKTEPTIISPHYYLVQKEFFRLRNKLEAVMGLPVKPPIGSEIVDPRAALKLWEKNLRRSASKLPSLFHSFSSTILARSNQAGYSQVQQALIPLEQEVNQLIALHHHLWQQPFPEKWNEGRLLLWRCIKKISVDLENIFTFFISIVEAWNNGEKAGGYTYIWDNEISCRNEIVEYKTWQKTMARSSVLPRKTRMLPEVIHAVVSRFEERYSFFCKA